jgi:hypothetical protein
VPSSVLFINGGIFSNILTQLKMNVRKDIEFNTVFSQKFSHKKPGAVFTTL